MTDIILKIGGAGTQNEIPCKVLIGSDNLDDFINELIKFVGEYRSKIHKSVITSEVKPCGCKGRNNAE